MSLEPSTHRGIQTQPMTVRELILLTFSPELRATLYQYTRNTSDMDDLLQETRFRLINLPSDEVSKIDDGPAYVFVIARNAAFDSQRPRPIVPIGSAADLAALQTKDEGARIEDQINAAQELRLLEKAVRGLPPQCQDVFFLRKVYGFSRREIAKKLQIAENTVHEQLARGVKRFEKLLSDSLPRGQSSLLQRWRARRVRGRGKP